VSQWDSPHTMTRRKRIVRMDYGEKSFRFMYYNRNDSGTDVKNPTFSASNGWFDRFVKRERLTIRIITTSGRKLPRDAPIHINKFLTECEPYMQMKFERCHTMSWEVMDCHFNRFLELFWLLLDIFLRFSHNLPGILSIKFDVQIGTLAINQWFCMRAVPVGH
jgi:hypothetical protein